MNVARLHVSMNEKADEAKYVILHGGRGKPVPISQLIVFRIHRIEGTYRVVLSAELPRVAAASRRDWNTNPRCYRSRSSSHRRHS